MLLRKLSKTPTFSKPSAVFIIPLLLLVLLFTSMEFVQVSSSSECTFTTNSTCDSFDNMKYDHIVVKGLPYDRGLSHGVQTKPKILRSIEYYKSKKTFLPWDECIEFVKAHYVPALERYYRRGLDEMRGIAAGAGVTFEDILILNSRYDLARVARMKRIRDSLKSNGTKPVREETMVVEDSTSGECTGAVALSSATESGDVILAQNWDIDDFIKKNDTAILLEVYPDPSEKIRPFVVLTEAGQLGRNGMNADGLGVTANGLWSTGDLLERDPIKHPHGWIPITLLRRIFLESPTFSYGLKNVLDKPRHVSVNMILATAEDEALSLEIVPDKYFLMSVPTEIEIMSHSNHFKSPAFLARDDIGEAARGSSSLFRDRRVYRALHSYHPDINEESFKVALQDHVGYPDSVCFHSVPEELEHTSTQPSEMTVASVIYNLSKRTYNVTKGPPCTAPYVGYKLDVPGGFTQSPNAGTKAPYVNGTDSADTPGE